MQPSLPLLPALAPSPATRRWCLSCGEHPDVCACKSFHRGKVETVDLVAWIDAREAGR